MTNLPIALQLYTVRDQTALDFPGTVRRVAEMGYAGVELAGDGGLSAQEMAALLAETGLELAGNHVPLDRMTSSLDEVIAFNQAIGATYVGVPFLGQEHRSEAGFRAAAEAMNRAGAALRDAGLALYYHNHAFEFEPLGGTTGMEILLGETDPELVGFECDVYWVQYGGQDPAAFIEANAGRFPLIHLKDMVGEGDQRTFAEVGEGTLDFAAIFGAAESQGAAWYIVEQDICKGSSLESAKLSLENLKRWGKA
jgi:sugar phosphate isomerase/epimerase